MLKEKGMTSNSFGNNNPEQKTSGEIFEDVFNDYSLNNKSKLWISKDSLIELFKNNVVPWRSDSIEKPEEEVILLSINILKELEDKND
jgi:hypothetical protein